MRLGGWSHGSPKQIQDGGGRHLSKTAAAAIFNFGKISLWIG